MELHRGMAGNDLLWKLEGELDDDSVLKFENMVLNSDYRGEDMILDLTEVDKISYTGRRSLDRVVKTVREKGANVRILPPEGKNRSQVDRIVLC